MANVTVKNGSLLEETPQEKAANAFVRWLEARAESDAEIGNDFMSEQIGNILLAENTEEMWDADEIGSIQSSKDLIDTEMSIKAFRVRRGKVEYENSDIPFFYVVEAAKLSDGEEFVFSTGAPLIMAKLKYAEDHKELPVECVIRASATSKGSVLKLRKISERAVKVR